MGDFQATPAQLDAAAKEIQSAQDDLTAIAVSLRGQIEPMAAKWLGSGANAFFEFHNSWQVHEKKIVDQLTNFGHALGATKATVTQVDEGEQANYNKMLGRLNG